VEASRRVHRVLAGHGVDHEEGVVRSSGVGDGPHLIHEGLIDRESSRGVDDDHVASQTAGLGETLAGHVDRRARLREDVDADLGAQHA
jgi:hypothetical protein